ncbi:MAG: hypothetical protein GF334_08710 [Candidatus Altiarchaeales archaeon]|nr:hypothetical protein [Candidatus Altiarchaeales archaeon]
MHLQTVINYIHDHKQRIRLIFFEARTRSRPQSWILERCRENMDRINDKSFPRWAREFLNGYKEALFDSMYEHLVHVYVIDGEIVKGEWNNMTENQRDYLRKTPDPVSGFVYKDTMRPYSDDLREHLERVGDEQVG